LLRDLEVLDLALQQVVDEVEAQAWVHAGQHVDPFLHRGLHDGRHDIRQL
jgi:hypothetical protein